MLSRHLPKGPRAPRKISSGAPHERVRMESGSEAALSTSQNMHSDPAILVQHLNAAYNLACYLMRDEIEAEDVVQTAYLLAIRHFAGFRGGNERAWILKIVRNSCYERLNKLGASREDTAFDEAMHSGASPHPDPEAAFAQAERIELVRKLLAELPEESREVLILREMEQLSYREIAIVIGLPVGTVMSRLSRARQRLQAHRIGLLEGGEIGETACCAQERPLAGLGLD
jgi:RNA polymerase sigma-70 factor, ECF subfamily